MTLHGRRDRIAAHRRGHGAEWLAAALLMAKGHVILAHRYKTPLGEIDLIARRGRRIAFVEVKQRPTRTQCEAALTGDTSRRIRAASDLWLARHTRYQETDIGFDAVLVAPWQFPQHLRDVL